LLDVPPRVDVHEEAIRARTAAYAKDSVQNLLGGEAEAEYLADACAVIIVWTKRH
jgi:hypothetical protein